MQFQRGLVFSWNTLQHHLKHSIENYHVKHLSEWFYKYSTPLYMPKDLGELERNIYKNKKYLFDGYPTIDRPYYKFILNPNELKKNKPEWYLIYWSPGVSSKMHNHPEKGCIWWLLDGSLTETKKNNDIIKHKTSFSGIALPVYVGGKEDYHQITNENDSAISLHVYWNDGIISNNQHHKK